MIQIQIITKPVQIPENDEIEAMTESVQQLPTVRVAHENFYASIYLDTPNNASSFAGTVNVWHHWALSKQSTGDD